MAKDNAQSILKNLIETARDGEKGFREAADHLKDPELKSFAQNLSSERANFARELEPELRAEGETDKVEGSTAGAMHRAWIDIKTALGGGDQTILDWMEQGEDTAKKAYSEAIKGALPSSAQTIVQRQYDRVLQSHDQVKALRDRRKAA